MASEISLAQTNQIRAALGLKLIPLDTARSQQTGSSEVKYPQAPAARSIVVPKPKDVKKSLLETTTTSDWLERMRKFRMQAPADTTRPNAVSEDKEVNEQITPIVEVHSVPAVNDVRDLELQAEPVPPQQLEPKLGSQIEHKRQIPPNGTIDYKPTEFKVRKQKSRKRRRLDHEYNLKISAPVLEEERPLLRVSSQPNAESTCKITPQVIKEQSQELNPQTVSLTSSESFLTNLKKSLGQGETVSETLPESVQGSHNHTSPEVLKESTEQAASVITVHNPMGIGATLSQLRSDGIVASGQDDVLRRNRRDWAKEVAAKRLVRVANLEEEARSLRTSNQKVAQDRIALKEEAQIAKQAFQEYNPVVDLVYKDAKGKVVSAKQAWKDLSHTFHGTSEGRKRSDKRKTKQEK